jgi:hypothetical protein
MPPHDGMLRVSRWCCYLLLSHPFVVRGQNPSESRRAPEVQYDQGSEEVMLCLLLLSQLVTMPPLESYA